jgi:ribosomal protein L32
VPCYRCGTRQADPEAGKSSPWRRGVIREHQVLICPACQPSALADLSRCARCGSMHLIRRLDQVECLDCRLTRDAEPEPPPAPAPGAPAAGGGDLAAEVARALERLLGGRGASRGG